MAVEEFELESVSLVLVLESSGPLLQVVVFYPSGLSTFHGHFLESNVKWT